MSNNNDKKNRLIDILFLILYSLIIYLIFWVFDIKEHNKSVINYI